MNTWSDLGNFASWSVASDLVLEADTSFIIFKALKYDLVASDLVLEADTSEAARKFLTFWLFSVFKLDVGTLVFSVGTFKLSLTSLVLFEATVGARVASVADCSLLFVVSVVCTASFWLFSVFKLDVGSVVFSVGTFKLSLTSLVLFEATVGANDLIGVASVAGCSLLFVVSVVCTASLATLSEASFIADFVSTSGVVSGFACSNLVDTSVIVSALTTCTSVLVPK